MTAVPLVDLAPWYSGGAAARRQVATDVDRALCEVGLLLVTGHHLGSAPAGRLRQAVRPFFARPVAAKAELACFPGGRGWVPPAPAPPELGESFGFGADGVPPAAAGTPEAEWFPPNCWPAGLPGLQDAATAYAGGCATLAADLLGVLALALDLADGFFLDRCRDGAWSVAVDVHPARQVCVAEATDVGTLTVRDGVPGWQVRIADGAWVDVPEVSGALTVTAGELLGRWTGDRWRAAPHRVLSSPGPAGAAVSLVFAHAPDPWTVIERLPTPAAGPARYEPVTAGQFLRSRRDSIGVG